MSKKAALRPSRQLLILVLVALIAFLFLLFFSRQTLSDTWQTLIQADIRFVLLLPLIQTVNYFFIGQYYRGMFSKFNTFFSRRRAWGVVAAMNFVNQVLPSGGLSGITYLAYGFRSNLEIGKTTLIQVGRYIFAFASYAVIGPIALWLLVASGDLDAFSGVVSDALSNRGAVITFAIFTLFGWSLIALIINQDLARAAGRRGLGLLNRIRGAWGHKKPYKLTLLRKLYREFNGGVDFLRAQGVGVIKPAVFMLFSALSELAIVFVSLQAVGVDVPIGVVFVSFVAANIVGVVSVIPGDVGVHEATVILVLAGFGVAQPAAISATLLYRVFNKFIFLPIGFYFYARILKPAVRAS